MVALTDSAGAVVATYEYDAYGNLLKETGTVENPYRYAGYRYDGETGLYYLQSRYYDPETGRFLTRDTFEGFENEPLSLNKYAYTENNPVMFVDPNGQFSWRYFRKGLWHIGWAIKHLFHIVWGWQLGFLKWSVRLALRALAVKVAISTKTANIVWTTVNVLVLISFAARYLSGYKFVKELRKGIRYLKLARRR